MKKLLLLFTALLPMLGLRAATVPAEFYSEAAAGHYYLYNVPRAQFMVRLSNNFPGLSESASDVAVARTAGGAYTIRFNDGRYLKTGSWNSQYLWTDGTAGAAENEWEFVPVDGQTHVYQLRRTAEETWGDMTGTFYANGTNASTTPTADCRWALVDIDAYDDMVISGGIPVQYRSEIPTEAGEYYILDVLTGQFLNTSTRSLSTEPSATSTLTPSGSRFLISGASGKYLKIGVYKGQYLWSDGDATSTKWTIEAEAGKESEHLYYIYTNNFTETNGEVAGKTMYLTGTNASAVKPSRARWALITEADYVSYLSSGEGMVDAGAVSGNKAAMVSARGDATSLLQNPTFERSADGWWGGERMLSQLYRGSGYAYEGNADGTVMLQTIKHMPKGVYRVVAAVRGAVGTSLTARVADVAGKPVVNQGTHSMSDQININGVMMPYSTLGGFNYSEGGQGWTWVTAEGSLDQDGHLKVEFVQTGTGTVSIADVHLYYISDGTELYAVPYTYGVDAAHHAVVCNLSTDNPNHIFTANAAITTASGETLSNNLVGGTVANLVLWDGFDFRPASDFIANRTTFYCNIPAGTVRTLCLPFSVSQGSAAGGFYEPTKLRDRTIALRAVDKPEAGKPYIYSGNTDVTVLKGSGNVCAEAAQGSMLVGTYTALNTLPEGCYVADGNTMNRVGSHTSLDAFSAYLVAESDARHLTLDFDAADADDVWQRPVVATSPLVVGQECYLYNIGAKRFYTEGNAYGTQASVGDTGLKVKFVANGDAVKLSNYSKAKNGWRWAFVTTNGAIYVDGDAPTECNWQVVKGEGESFKLMISSPNERYNQDNYPGAMMGLDLFENNLRTNLAALLFDYEEPGDDIYQTDWTAVSVADYDAYQQAVVTYKDAAQLKALIDEATLAGIDVADETAVYENTNSTQAQIQDAINSVRNKLTQDELRDASWDNPVDLTDRFVTNATYAANDNEGWSGSAPGIDAGGNLQNAEFFNTNFDCYQDITGLPDGYYRLSLQGFYRAGLEAPSLDAKRGGNEDAVMHAVLYAVTAGKTVSTKMQSIFTGASETALGVSGEIHNGDWWVPNTMSSAAAYFAAGYYQNNSVIVQVTNGKLRIGLRKSTTIRRDWVMFDNWKLEYMGKNDK